MGAFRIPSLVLRVRRISDRLIADGENAPIHDLD
jgi:hypothetical protein